MIGVRSILRDKEMSDINILLDFWAGIMCDYKHLNKINNELIKHIRVGIPASIRGMVWQLLAKSKNEELVIKYTDLLKLPSPYDKMIQRDLARTFPGHVYFKETNGQGQEGLYNVVRAYSLYDDEVGYCQGLAFIVGPMLLNVCEKDVISHTCFSPLINTHIKIDA